MRLHITPLTPDLLQVVLGPQLADSAQNLSYQKIQTFPENNYGFVDLPESEAKRLIAKLNGSFLKGRKMKVEEARASKRSRTKLEKEESTEAEPVSKKAKKEKRAKKDTHVLEGFELEGGRKVKRGWTEPKTDKSKSSGSADKTKKAKKSQAPSKYTEKEELLFKSNVPPNKQDLIPEKKRTRSKKNEIEPMLVHEFEETQIQPSFLRNTTTAKTSTEYVDGQGWVDEDGVVIEKESPSRKRMRAAKPPGLTIDLPAQKAAKKSVAVTTRADSDIKLDPKSNPGSEVFVTEHIDAESTTDIDETSSSGTSETDGDDAEGYRSGGSVRTESSSIGEPAVEIPESTEPEVHPLEALFKKPQAPDHAKPSLEIETSFTFLDRNASDSDEEDDTLPPEPLTPFTSQELRSRGMRSAAPTPDTAHPSRFPSWSSALSGEEESARGRRSVTPSRPGDKPQSEFEKRFWAERGQNNRAWKARLRNARKEQRQKENRSRRSRHGT